MLAVILVGGQGTRLRPLTLARAKPVVPFLNRPFLAYQLALLHRHGITDGILACAYRVDDVRDALGEETFGVRLRYVVEKEPLGTGGGVRNAADLGAGAVYVLNGDILTDVDLAELRRLHQARRAQVSIVLTRVADPRPYGLVETAADGRIVNFREKPAPGEPVMTDTVNAGVYLIDAEVLRRIPADRPVSIEREVFPALIAQGVPCFGWALPAYWRDIGSPIAYRAAQMDLLDGRVHTPLPPPGEWRDGAWFGGGGSMAPGARIQAPAVIGRDVTIGPGAQVGPRAVIGHGCRIGAEARVEHAVLWEAVEVGPGAVLSECVVATGVRIGAKAEIGRDQVLEPGAVIPERTHLGG